jgi:sigma-70, region 4
MEETYMPKEYYLYVNGQKVKVSEQIYKVYWREREHEKYLEQVDRKNHLLFFSSLDHDGHFIDNIADESVDVEKIVETQMMIEAVRNAISMLNAEERDIVERLYFNDETLSSIARGKKVSYQAIQWRKNSILKKLRVLLEEFMK